MITIKTILCPIDFSEPSKKAFRYACAFAGSMGAKLCLVAVIEPRPLVADMMLTYIPIEEDLRRDANEEIKPLVKEALNEGIEVRTDVLIGHPVDVILKHVNDLGIDLLIMGSHGKTGLRRILMGSVTEGVIRKSGIPVLIVRETEGELISEK